MPQSTEKRTAIYARSSTNARTTESQLEACRRAAEHLGLDVIQEFVDEDISGTISPKSRPGTLELMTSLGSFEVLLVPSFCSAPITYVGGSREGSYGDPRSA